MPDRPPNGNGYPRWRDIERLDAQDRVLGEGQRWLSEMGQKHNEQINQLRGDVHDMKPEVAKVPILEERQKDVLQALNRARTAGWAAAGSLLVLAAAVITQGHP